MAEKHIYDVRPILAYLLTNERSIKWLGEKAGIPYGTLYSALVMKERSLSDKNRKKINSALKTKF